MRKCQENVVYVDEQIYMIAGSLIAICVPLGWLVTP